ELAVYRGLSASETWQRLELRFSAPETGTVRIFLGGEFRGAMWWDDVSLEMVDERPERLATEWLTRLGRGRIFTGLVVDARGLGVERAMSPRIYDEEGSLLYAGTGARPGEIVTHGVVAYATDIQTAAGHSRLAVSPAFPYRYPLIVRALRVAEGPVPTSVVIHRGDAARLRSALEEYDFLGRFAVVFLIDPH
ncbi:MAG TPA: hypothetical protein VF234_05485, partial [Limnochordia bacterium]